MPGVVSWQFRQIGNSMVFSFWRGLIEAGPDQKENTVSRYRRPAGRSGRRDWRRSAGKVHRKNRKRGQGHGRL